ncbi:hypothetical protein FYJ34_06050 [Clostridiaceae bacterium 68-1-5]|uniref:Uncharacterized protein n=1 Tax=Suipraeoptans intestinalis TaxID=2606628 RepID=A0A6N7V1V3_9FIRM|nr:hypothetical protein [Suipraeoptans intestinalis]
MKRNSVLLSYGKQEAGRWWEQWNFCGENPAKRYEMQDANEDIPIFEIGNCTKVEKIYMIEENPRKLQGEMKLFLQFPGGGIIGARKRESRTNRQI